MCTKKSRRFVGSGKPTGTGSVLRETIAVFGTIWISAQNRHSRILLRDLLRGKLRKMHREPEVRDAEVRVEECLDCLARITSKELASTHSVKSGILQNACSTSPRMDADLWISALERIAKFMNSLAKGLKGMVTKCSGYAENYTTIGLCISGYGAAEVFIDFPEELKHTETNRMCSIHKSRRTSC